MFDLEQEIREWRRNLAAAAGLNREILAELEGHLREDFERQVRSGSNATEAWQAALQRIGTPRQLRSEFELSGTLGIAEALRRHKWKLLLCSAAGLLAAVVLNFLRPAPYQSETKMLIRYAVANGQLVTRSANQTNAIEPDNVLDRMMREQLEILTSLELAQRVAQDVGPKTILNGMGGGDDLVRATKVISSGLRVLARANSSVIETSFQHPNPRVVQPVLRKVLDHFLKLHVETFRATEDQTMVPGKISNISLITPPSPPSYDFGALFRTRAWIVAAGVLAGLVWVCAVSYNRFGYNLAR